MAAAPPAAASGTAAAASASGGKKAVLKLILLGQAGTGKTSLLNRFVDDTFAQQYKATLGADMRDREVRINDQPVVLQIWDTAGQERFNSLTSMFLKGADAVLLVFDLTRADSFESLNLWRDQFLASTRNDRNFPFACVANKCELSMQRAVSQRKANNWCSQNMDMPYMEVSAKEGTNVHQVFLDLARKAMKRRQAEREAEQSVYVPPPSVVLPPITANPTPAAKKKSASSCCA